MPEDEIRSDCREIFRDIREDLARIRNAVEGKNGGKGLKETVAQHSTMLKILGAAVVAIGGAAAMAIVKALT